MKFAEPILKYTISAAVFWFFVYWAVKLPEPKLFVISILTSMYLSIDRLDWSKARFAESNANSSLFLGPVLIALAFGLSVFGIVTALIVFFGFFHWRSQK